MTEEKLYIGMDIGKNHVLVSCFTEGNGEPETLSTIAGSEQYQIPMALYKKRGIGQWYFGREAFGRRRRDAHTGSLGTDEGGQRDTDRRRGLPGDGSVGGIFPESAHASEKI